MKKPLRLTVTAIAVLLPGIGMLTDLDVASAAEQATGGGNVDDARIINAPVTEPGSWLAYGQTYKEQRFSQL
ncbi:MAG: hypothetical protein QGF90_13260, partial [Gammaproteobacteria bacterium]|nr:hypothetical protein [Gammaproteobacteria bacterium]